jgi:hypothetical protein
MGIQTYLLGGTKVRILIGGVPVKAGTLRRFWKVTEIEAERATEISAAEARVRKKAAPALVMVADVDEMPLADKPDQLVPAHLVLGWDPDRFMVTDFNWDYLPVIGYAVRQSMSDNYELYEEVDGFLKSITIASAIEGNILSRRHKYILKASPTISQCYSVGAFISNFAQARCALNNGCQVDLLTAIPNNILPNSNWYIGKRTLDVTRYQIG